MIPLLDLRARQTLVFSDLDGTLLDHHSYSFSAAQGMLNWLREHNVPVIPVTSKTRVEVRALRDQMRLKGPYVIENGAALYVPDEAPYAAQAQNEGLTQQEGEWVKAFAPPRAQWLRWLNHVAEQLPNAFTCFSWLGDAGIASATGLSEEHAHLANRRDYSEPVLWQGSDAEKQRFMRLAERQGYSVIEGGRFLHVTSGYDKGQALRWLARFYEKTAQNLAAHAQQEHSDRPVYTIALGDSGNDVDMLEAADLAFVIRSPVKSFPEGIQAANLHYSEACGPEGWQECLAAAFGASTQHDIHPPQQ